MTDPQLQFNIFTTEKNIVYNYIVSAGKRGEQSYATCIRCDFLFCKMT